MCLASRMYGTLVEILTSTNHLEPGASLLQCDRVIAQQFDVAESTARNWRRCKHAHVAPATVAAIIARVATVAPNQAPQLEFLDRISRGVQEVKAAAERLVEQLSVGVFGNEASWHIYSGPLRMAFDLNSMPFTQQQLMRQSAMIVERVLELNIDPTDIPCIPELIRYSTHGWYLQGLFQVREASLNSRLSGIQDSYLSPVEVALYVGDGCATPSFLSGNPERALRYTRQALALLDEAGSDDARAASVSIADARTMIRSIETIIACYDGYQRYPQVLADFIRDFAIVEADIEWVEGTRHEALGCIELARRQDFAKAAFHFEQAGKFLDQWIGKFGIPFSTTSPQSLVGYSLLMTDGPTETARSQISEGLLRTIDLGNVAHQIRARVCQARLYECEGSPVMAKFHQNKALELVEQHQLFRWHAMLNHVLLPATSNSILA